MAVMWIVKEGEGVRIDGIDIWTVERIIEDGTAAELRAPDGSLVTLREDVPFRVGPAFRMSLAPGAPEGCIHLVMDAYAPLMHRHPPRNHKKAPVAGGRR